MKRVYQNNFNKNSHFLHKSISTNLLINNSSVKQKHFISKQTNNQIGKIYNSSSENSETLHELEDKINDLEIKNNKLVNENNDLKIENDNIQSYVDVVTFAAIINAGVSIYIITH
ncbi:hypothetical protein QLL95_gp0989 [Cotonvirus japonicus]|uniref:Uncharacterized protein n=1 Tax=Cotonvirus japonicus TaxID=2811091 RepID=A0ABM7NSJ5_9VIRU|nr:hypothetical protein QLL95_gp0989 [Cotonvirus japonicus]BCS83134.1 hypothetical protein [Cotonvirus japonicus]